MLIWFDQKLRGVKAVIQAHKAHHLQLRSIFGSELNNGAYRKRNREELCRFKYHRCGID